MNPNEKEPITIQYFVHEGMMARAEAASEKAMARMERVYKITVYALVAALAISVIAFLVNDSLWRKYCKSIEERYGIYEQSDSSAN